MEARNFPDAATASLWNNRLSFTIRFYTIREAPVRAPLFCLLTVTYLIL